jgi:serine protease AprX
MAVERIYLGNKTRGGARLVFAAALLIAIIAGVSPGSAAAGGTASVIVRAAQGRIEEARETVERLGGRPGAGIDIIDGFVADIPASSLDAVADGPGVVAVTPNIGLRAMSRPERSSTTTTTATSTTTATTTEASTQTDGVLFGTDPSLQTGGSSSGVQDPRIDPTSMYTIAGTVLNVDSIWQRGYTGRGVDVALIDSGVVPVKGLTEPGAIVNGPDISFESRIDDARYLDGFGHGTHLAGIIAGRDDGDAPMLAFAHGGFTGIAPQSRVVSVKVASSTGATDLSQVLAAINWVVLHRQDAGMNIRVMNLAYGTDSSLPYTLDPLAYAVEAAWRSGIVVVVAAGNSNFGSSLPNNPATDPFIISVGAADTPGTLDPSMYTVPSWSARSTLRGPDLLAPGRSITSLRSPGSFVDDVFPSSRVGDRYTRGSGTSQASAMVSGIVALLLQQRPSMTPNQVKRLLVRTANPLKDVPTGTQGAGLVDVVEAFATPTPSALESFQWWLPSVGGGTLEASRGTVHVSDADGVVLQGEIDIFGRPYSRDWTGAALTDGAWTGSSWSGRSWSSTGWMGSSWSGKSWAGSSWSGKSWAGSSWSGKSWSGRSWSGKSWSAAIWGR